MKEILPIGSVVLLEGAEDFLMIIGYLPKGIDNVERDYMGVVYPIGLMDISDVKAFNREDIREVIFEGDKDNILFEHFKKKMIKDNLFTK